jgi:formylglycine-generating enzyme required for sulfatase activity
MTDFFQEAVLVTRFDAIAFCRWLSDKCRSVITVPSEPHWLRAAQGDDGREYPWGNFFDLSRCNSFYTQIGQITPVNSFPTGSSPFGVCDLSGNAPEWVVLGSGLDVDELSNSAYFHIRGTGFDDSNKEHYKCTYRGISYTPGTERRASFRICVPSLVTIVNRS